MNYDHRREKLIKKLIRDGRIDSESVISAMGKIPRELFVPLSQKLSAYEDTPLPIGSGQTISAPHMVGIMAEALEVKPGQKILEVGAGSGYHAAVIGEIIGPNGHLYSIERIEELASRAIENIKKVGLTKIITIIHNDGSLGLTEYAPYDRIFVTCASPGIPSPLIDQLADGGKLLIPSGSSYISELILVTKSDKKIKKRNLGGCAFVPLRGKYGFN